MNTLYVFYIQHSYIDQLTHRRTWTKNPNKLHICVISRLISQNEYIKWSEGKLPPI